MSKTLLKSIIFFAAFSLLSRLYFIVNQYFAVQLSVQYLTAISLISYVTLFFQMVGAAFGQSVLNLRGKSSNDAGENKIFAGAFVGTYLVSILLGFFFFAIAAKYLYVSKIDNLPGALSAYRITVVCASLMAVNTFFRFCLFAEGSLWFIVIIELLSQTSNFAFNHLCFKILPDSGTKFSAMATTMLIIQVLQFFAFIFHYRKSIHPFTTHIWSYFSRAGGIVFSELSYSVLMMSEVIFFSFILDGKGQPENVAAYNVGVRMISFLTAPSNGLVYGGVIWLASSWEKRNSQIWDHKIRSILLWSAVIGGLPILLGLLTSPLFVPALFGLHGQNSVIVIDLLLLSILPWIFTTHLTCQIKIFESSRYLAWSQLISIYLLGLPIGYYFSRHGTVVQMVLYGILVPSVVRALANYKYQNRLTRFRRTTLRIKLPHYLNAQILTLRSADRLINKKFAMADLGLNGAGMIVPRDSSEIFKIGDVLISEIWIGESFLMSFSCSVKHLTLLKEGFFKKRDYLQVGLEFQNMEPQSKQNLHEYVLSVKAA